MVKRTAFDNKRAVYLLARTALCTATLTAGKFVLSGIPNVEVVTLLCALYGTAFGGYGVLSSLLFVAVEPLLYGFGPWLCSYVVYWPTVSAVFWFLRKRGVKNRFSVTLSAVFMTVAFGFLTTLFDILLTVGIRENFLEAYRVKYLAGIPFYLSQIITNAVLFPILFVPCTKALQKANKSSQNTQN